MKIGVISDTHGNIAALKRAIDALDGVDLILHAGDVLYHPPRLGCLEGYDIPACVDVLNKLEVPLLICQGNCDAQVYEELLKVPMQSPCVYSVLGGIRVLVTHGHLMNKREMVDLARRLKADYAISGHTHVPVLEKEDGVVVMNPGSTSIPKFEVKGRPAPSCGIITKKGARIIDLTDGSVLMQTK